MAKILIFLPNVAALDPKMVLLKNVTLKKLQLENGRKSMPYYIYSESAWNADSQYESHKKNWANFWSNGQISKK